MSITNLFISPQLLNITSHFVHYIELEDKCNVRDSHSIRPQGRFIFMHKIFFL